jgi:hypothetical protein
MVPFYGTRAADEATTLEKLCSLQRCGALPWPMYWQASVQVIGAISLILFECTYNISLLAGAVCLLLERRIDGEAGCQEIRNLEKIRNLAPHLTLRLTYFRMHRLLAKKVLHQIK